ncbi:23S rRNA (adenine(2030)-N(6))-methyltransferase RlmJ [Aerophototrophica crusticola]|uniref:Ribosomal RNA large subunit methyltransferase J n=1 Tax=Aerophototrophica crusticola TaxID=1709002 RepID=A0A858R663_9PROT|nr:23S rRNA (adenine(2030)-N(6))-methyltransferase RlmJ [Rhodospirillaceae bacterium B3]
MNYRHAYHAGNPADVVKHAVLCLLLQKLTAKPAPFCVLDTHAGIGGYDLDATEAQKTREAEAGIRRLLALPDLPVALAPYLEAVRALNPGLAEGKVPLRHYPGSPLLARHFLREQDRLVLAELHPDDAQTLRRALQGEKRAAVHHMDGWLALKAHLPPKEKRGLVVIDPPFEATDEYGRLAAALALVHRRWATGQVLAWYPIKDRASVWRLHQQMEDLGIPKVLAAELTWSEDDRSDRLNGSGLILVNPPWQLDATLAELLPALHRLLGGRQGGGRVDWIVPEAA